GVRLAEVQHVPRMPVARAGPGLRDLPPLGRGSGPVAGTAGAARQRRDDLRCVRACESFAPGLAPGVHWLLRYLNCSGTSSAKAVEPPSQARWRNILSPWRRVSKMASFWLDRQTRRWLAFAARGLYLESPPLSSF